MLFKYTASTTESIFFAAPSTVALSRRQPAFSSTFRGSFVGRNDDERNTVLIEIHVFASCIPLFSFEMCLIDIDCSYPVLLNRNLIQPYKLCTLNGRVMAHVSIFQEILKVSCLVLGREINYKKDFGLEYYKLYIFESVFSVLVYNIAISSQVSSFAFLSYIVFRAS
jgi:hypothetical protein